MKEIILKVLSEVSLNQLNLQSESAREMIANKLEPELQKYVQEVVEYAVMGGSDECCGGGCHDS
tara:strand:- start:577 stop:768 length:192 start_codon:yes stop_codon:yes gene_type:complete